MKVMLDDGAYMPEYAHALDAGMDIRSREDKIIPAHGFKTFDTGVHTQIPEGYVGFLKSKSGLNVKYNITGTGVIDAGYTGPIVVKLYNNGDIDHAISKGDKIIQMVVMPINHVSFDLVNSFEETERGNGGFGSTGK